MSECISVNCGSSLVAVCDIGSASFKYDMRRLLEILALPKAWYRRSLARRMFLGEEPTVPDDDSQSGNVICLCKNYSACIVSIQRAFFICYLLLLGIDAFCLNISWASSMTVLS